MWMAKVKVLAELVEHHIEEEEEEMLKNVKKEFDAETRMEIGQKYLTLQSEFSEDSEEMPAERSKKSSEVRAH